MATGHSRRCALCQQFYSTGFVDNVPAGELLRARRMLMERSTEDDGPSSRLIREGFDQFLDELTREREALEVSQRNMPLDVCVFCMQFLPSTYFMGIDEEEVRVLHSAGYVGPVQAAPPTLVPATRCNSGGQVRSSLVIQHQLPSKKMTPTALGKNPRTVRMAASLHRPQSCALAPSNSLLPRTSPTYRLQSNDATRVLRIESPTAALHSMAIGHDSNQQRSLAATDVMSSLRVQEQHQIAAIFRAEASKREVYRRHRASVTKLAQKTARERSERMTGSAKLDAQHQNIIDALIKGAGTLYSGVVVAQQKNEPPTPTPRTNLTAGASKVVTRKHGRHFKTELFFPAIPMNARSTTKK